VSKPTDAKVKWAYEDFACPDPNGSHLHGCPSGQEYDRWLTDHDAATREAVLAEVAEWLESFGHYDNIAEQVLTLPPHTPQIVPETGLGA